MVLRTRLSLGSLFAASAVVATALAWHEHRAHQRHATQDEIIAWAARTSAADNAPPAESPIATDEPQQLPDSELHAEGGGEAPGPDAPSATVDKLDLTWLPAGYVRDVGDDKTAALAQLVEDWAVSSSDDPRIVYRRGVVFARSAEDRPDDGPYPRSVQPQGTRVCGEASVWLRDSLRQRLANEALTCDKNVCSYCGGEDAPDGFVIFRELDIDGRHTWALDAWIEVYRDDLSSETIAQNQAEIGRALRHELRTSCAGEPAGAY